jgi:glutathione S-transferase
MYKIYVIPGSHACRSGILMLEHKGVPFEVHDIVTLMHPVAVRLRGFDAGGQTRMVGSRRTLGTWFGDHVGTVPALAAGKERISTNHGIARFLEERHPDPPLFPADPDKRAAVEEVEAWANDELQMAARRIPGVAVVRDPEWFASDSGDGRMGYLLYKREWARRAIVPRILRQVFNANPARDDELLAQLVSMLDRIDGYIADGLLNRRELNVADFMVAPSLALILYRPDVMPYFKGRQALDLVDRLLPDPRAAPVPG